MRPQDEAKRLVDTAGIRKRGKRDHTNRLEDLSVEEAVRALRYAQVRGLHTMVCQKTVFSLMQSWLLIE